MGLYDREYMYQERNENQGSGRSPMWYIIIINLLMYFFVASPGSESYNTLALAANRQDAVTLVQLVSCGFLHANFSHILANMYGLYLFGSIAAPILGEKRFLILYFSGIITSSLAFYAINYGKHTSLVGASGAICAVTIAAAMTDPEKKFLIIFMPFTPIKITTMVICYTLLNFLLAVGDNPNDPTSYLAHLAGFISGYIAMKIIGKDTVRWDPLKLKKTGSPRHTAPPPPKADDTSRRKSEKNNSAPVSNAELDALLDKVSREGINSLSEYELSRLRQARKQMRGE